MMATIPVLSPRPTPNPQRAIVSDRSGDIIASGVRSLAGAVGEVADNMSREADAQAVFEARRKLDEWERASIYDPKTGAANKLGRDAFDLPEKMPAQFDEFAGKVAEGLTTTRQKQAFRDLAQSRRSQILDWTSRHTAQQREVFERGQFEADLSSMRERAAMFADDPAKVAGELAVANQRIIGYMRGKGLSEEQTQAAIRENASRAHAGVLESLIQGQKWGQAQTYLTDNRASMDAGVASKAAAAIQVGEARIRAQAFGDEAVSKGMTMRQALDEARARFAGKDEEDAVREVKERFQEADVMRRQEALKIKDTAWTEVMQSGRVSPTTLTTLRQVAPEEERQIRDWQDAKARQAKADAEGNTAKTDMNVYMGLRYMAMDPETAGDFAKLDLRKSAPFLAPSDLKHLQEVQASIGRGDMKAMESQRVLKQTLGIIRAEVQAAGIDMTPKEGTKQAKETAMFMGALTQALDQATAEKGRPLTSDEARRIGMSMVREGVEQGSGLFGMFQTKKRGYQIATDTSIAPGASFVSRQFKDIPAADRDALIRELYPNGAPRSPYSGVPIVDEAAIERAYQRGLDRGVFR